MDELRRKAEELELNLQFDKVLSPLARRIEIGSSETPNALAIHPMEGCDGEGDGRPGELTIRRYERFARGGAGLRRSRYVGLAKPHMQHIFTAVAINLMRLAD